MKILLTLIFFVVACAPGPTSIARQNLLKLQIGMTKDQVLQTMGNPYKNEAFSTTESVIIDAYFYLTEIKFDELYRKILNDETITPIIFIDGKVVGWGWSFYRDTTQKYDIDIEIKGETP